MYLLLFWAKMIKEEVLLKFDCMIQFMVFNRVKSTKFAEESFHTKDLLQYEDWTQTTSILYTRYLEINATKLNQTKLILGQNTHPPLKQCNTSGKKFPEKKTQIRWTQPV